jgi:hypothetical protein
VTLTLCRGLSAADWIAHSDLQWSVLVGFGPAGFDAYGRLRILPDPARPGQSENDVEVEDWRRHQLTRLFELLATHTASPEECYFCVWDGYGGADEAVDDGAVYIDDEDEVAQFGRLDARPGAAPRPAVSTTISNVPKVVVPNRAYWLFRGPLADVGDWDSAHGWPGEFRLNEAEPAFVGPGDRAWCVAKDVDPHWAGIGGDAALITRLTNHPDLDVVPLTRPRTSPPTSERPGVRLDRVPKHC